MNAWHLLWIIPLALIVGSQLTSWYERKYKYNLNDLEKAELRKIYQSGSTMLQSALDKLRAAL